MTNGLPVGLPLLCRRPIKKMIFFHYPRVSPGAAPLTKKPEDSGYEIGDKPETSTAQNRSVLGFYLNLLSTILASFLQQTQIDKERARVNQCHFGGKAR